nr:hypothetical protein BaRGS_031764 [Batillaria attramentaria]
MVGDGPYGQVMTAVAATFDCARDFLKESREETLAPDRLLSTRAESSSKLAEKPELFADVRDGVRSFDSFKKPKVLPGETSRNNTFKESAQ